MSAVDKNAGVKQGAAVSARRGAVSAGQVAVCRHCGSPLRTEAARFARTLQSFNYSLGPPGADVAAPPESRELAKRIGLCTAFAMNIMLFTLPAYFGMEASFPYARLFGTLAMVFGTLSFLAGGGYFLGRAVGAVRARVLHIDLPIALGILGAYGGSVYGWLAMDGRFVHFDFVGSFILLMLVGRWAQVAAVERNRRRLLRHQLGPQSVRGRRSIEPDRWLQRFRDGLRQHFGRARSHEHVVFDPDAAEIEVGLDLVPNHSLAKPGAAFGIVEQRGNEIEAGLDGHHETGRERDVQAEALQAGLWRTRPAGEGAAGIAHPEADEVA